MRHLTRKNIRLLLTTLLGICCLLAVSYKGNNHTPFIQIGSLQLPSSTISGVLAGSLYLICILLVLIDYKNGFKVALVLNLIANINLIFGMIMLRSIVSMPGFVTNTVSLVTLIIIYLFYSKLSVSNMTDYITGQGNRRSYVKEVSEHIESKKSFENYIDKKQEEMKLLPTSLLLFLIKRTRCSELPVPSLQFSLSLVNRRKKDLRALLTQKL